MKNIYEILKGIGIEVPEEQKETFDKEWKENYRTKVEYDKAVEKRDEYKESLENVQGELEGFKDIDVNELKNQVSTLTTQLQEEKAARVKDAARVELEKNVDSFLSEKKFVNPITQDAIRKNLMEELDKDSAKGKSIADIFTGLITDADGKQMENILVDEQREKLEGQKARFTNPLNTGGAGALKVTREEFLKMGDAERILLKQNDPDTWATLIGRR
ncbi:phage scaffolding protein [Eisenbergiella tayi]|uniref:phage scaffolding protein n=1 Tax=Eisenbergiella tayi TaxID=1432052 RepID=UPI00307BF67F